MTRAVARKGAGRFFLRCEGHAETSAACNYVTGVMYALAGYAQNRAEVLALEVDEQAPCFLVDCRGGETVEAVFDAAVIGLLLLSASHPAEISVETENF